MCGILVRILQHHLIDSSAAAHYLIANINKRGPDLQHSIIVKLASLNLHLHGAVLNLRGPSQATLQPHPTRHGYLLFNGEIYSGLAVPSDANDVHVLAESLNQCTNLVDVLAIINNIHGPFALVYHFQNFLLVGRDVLGRRSLLWNMTDCDEFGLYITSVASSTGCEKFEDVSTDGIYVLDLSKVDSTETKFHDCVTLAPWKHDVVSIYPTFPFEPLNAKLDAPLIRKDTTEEVNELYNILANSVRLRTMTIPPPLDPLDARLGILFSGGLDCMVLAALATENIAANEPIHLLNVAFENPRSNTAQKREATIRNNSKKNKTFNETRTTAKEASILNQSDEQDLFDVPDRRTARQGFDELIDRFPSRKWVLVEIDVSFDEYTAMHDRIVELVFPCTSVMDFSIAIAFWFAARGRGTFVFADKMGWGLTNSIATRNLGRDDRIVSDHGREIRLPYLDENVVRYLSSLPVYTKTDPRLERGWGEKILLRELSLDKRIGPLTKTSREAKRAIQFGARTAKMTGKEDGKSKISTI